MPLSPEVIFEAAMRLMDAEGIDALTMRRLASELGVAPMSLYSHVPTKEQLLLGVVNLVTGEIALPEPGTSPWKASKDLIRSFRQVALRHPNLVPLTMRQPPTGAGSVRTLEAALDALWRAGVGPKMSAPGYRFMASFAIGFVSLECGGFFKPVDPTAGGQVAPVDLRTIPRLVEVAPFLAEWDADLEFERSLDAVIRSVAAWAGLPDPGEDVQCDCCSGGHVEGVDPPGHGDADPAVGGS